MVYTCCTPLAMKERIFAEAKAMGARFIRVDVELSAIFPAGDLGDPEWARFDEVLALSRKHDLPVLGILLHPPGSSPPDPQVFGRLAGEVAARARGTIEHWEILNEPVWAYRHAPAGYAYMLRAAHDAIGARVPEARIALGSDPLADPAWIDRLFATPGADAAHAFDIANVNLRDSPRWLPGHLAAWRGRLARHGFTGPVWVTEHGYPGDLAFQSDPLFRGGEAAQASFLTESVLTLATAGANEVFVTLRDNHSGRWLSEGVVAIDNAPPYAARRKPAFGAVRRLVDNWPALVAAYAERQLHAAAMRVANGQAAAGASLLRRQRALARAARLTLTRLRIRRQLARPGPSRGRLRRRVVRASLRLRERRTGVGWARAVTRDYRLRAAVHRQRALDLAAFVAGGWPATPAGG
jgi:hypothetical protein